MTRYFLFTVSFVLLLLLGCSTDQINTNNEEETGTPTTSYFPPIDSNLWESISTEELGWNLTAEQPLYDFLVENDTDAFIILKNGRIVWEKYFGDFTQDDNHAWNSAGKTLTAMTVGIAQEEGFLNLDDSTVDYLGEGWSSMSLEQEQAVTIRNHLTMSTGLDYATGDIFCYDPECLLFKNEPNTFWYYHNAPYTLLDQIVTGATDVAFKDYFYKKIRDKIGMQGLWVSIGYNNIYFSTARSMARFGILNLNNGVWDNEIILGDTTFLRDMKNTSQNMNPSYGYLWWLNGKLSYKAPGSEATFNGKLIENAPNDLYAGLGKNDQKLYVVPSQDLVIVRMGGDAGEAQLGPSSFDNELWGLLNDLMQ
ncbi:serine hydrolase domain-containing protein [Maribacter sp. CXY002]|uniref:serine hydrolase domain-containing protein n=1 Tax=Maribacter luteocoastalis TaxID=3407671 RepID=UPI003B681694